MIKSPFCWRRYKVSHFLERAYVSCKLTCSDGSRLSGNREGLKKNLEMGLFRASLLIPAAHAICRCLRLASYSEWQVSQESVEHAQTIYIMYDNRLEAPLASALFFRWGENCKKVGNIWFWISERKRNVFALHKYLQSNCEMQFFFFFLHLTSVTPIFIHPRWIGIHEKNISDEDIKEQHDDVMYCSVMGLSRVRPRGAYHFNRSCTKTRSICN